MILAAGLGRRMQVLTRDTPKPMLEVAGKPLLEHLVCRLVEHGIRELVMNHSRWGERIEGYFGDGGRWGATICYSAEGDVPRGTHAGVVRALPLLGGAPFVLANADAWTDYPFSRLRALQPDMLAHLVLVDNPAHHPEGDFSLLDDGILAAGAPRYTYSGIGLYDPKVFNTEARELGPRLRNLAGEGRLTGERYTGAWLDVGTAERLAQARKQVAESASAKQS